MISDSSLLKLLLARLLHFDGMVRERTCSAMARLLNNLATTTLAREHLTVWVVEQQLESVVILALLIWHKARIDNSAFELPRMEENVSGFHKPSVLSWMLMEDLYDSKIPEPNWRECYSAGLTRGFQPDDFFGRHVREFLPPIYSLKADEIETRTGAPFALQWAWEWTHIIARLGIRPTNDPLYLVSDRDRPFVPCFDFYMSEVYRSAFLRALAWACDQGAIQPKDAQRLAIPCCPVDLGMWAVRCGHTPDWWPKISSAEGPISDAPSQIVEQLGALWSQKAPEADDWWLAQCSGFVEGSDTHYQLEVYGVFQKCLGQEIPSMGEVIDRLCRRAFEPLLTDRPLQFSGCIMILGKDATEKRFADWECIPAFTGVASPVIPRWQWWRHFGQVLAPSLILTDSGFTIEPVADELRFRTGPQIVGRWKDWVTALRNTMDANLPPATGQALFIKSEALHEFCEKENCTFCWIWRLTAYHRTHDYTKYDTVTHEGQFGATRISLE